MKCMESINLWSDLPMVPEEQVQDVARSPPTAFFIYNGHSECSELARVKAIFAKCIKKQYTVLQCSEPAKHYERNPAQHQGTSADQRALTLLWGKEV